MDEECVDLLVVVDHARVLERVEQALDAIVNVQAAAGWSS